MRTKLVLLILGLAAFMIGCADDEPTAPTPTAPSVYVNQSVIVGQPAQSGQSGAACGASDPLPTSLNVFTLDGSGQVSLATGGIVLNATPKPVASDPCNESRGISWAVSTPAICALSGDLTSFTPRLLPRAVGTCTVQAVVMGVTGLLSLPVVP
jgi:hypothetical protein